MSGTLFRCLLSAWVGVGCVPHAAEVPDLPRTATRVPRSPPARWTAYESATCDMRLEFPGTAVAATVEVQTPNGSQLVETHTLAADGADRAMVASCTRVEIANAELSRLLDLARDGVVKGTGATLVEERASIGGRELRLSLQNHELRARLVVMSGKLLTLVVGPVDAFDEPSVVRFLESPRSMARSAPTAAKPRAN